NPAVINVGVSAIPSSLLLVYCAALVLGVGVLCGLLPARSAWTASEVTPTGGLQRWRGARRLSLQRALVSGQVAISFILLSTAAVLVLTFVRLQMADPGFDVTHAISVEVRLPRPNPNDFFALRDAVSAASGVVAVSSDQGFGPPVAFFQRIRKAGAPGDAELLADVARVGPHYF